MALSLGHPRGTHSHFVIGCCLIPLRICGLKNNSRRITYEIRCVWGMPSLSPLSSLDPNVINKVKNVTFVRKSGKLLSDNWKGISMFSGKLKKCVSIIDLGPIYMEVGDPRWGGDQFRWGNPPVHIRSYGHPVYHVNLINLNWKII